METTISAGSSHRSFNSNNSSHSSIQNGLSHSPSAASGTGSLKLPSKLLPKAISNKRMRKKQTDSGTGNGAEAGAGFGAGTGAEIDGADGASDAGAGAAGINARAVSSSTVILTGPSDHRTDASSPGRPDDGDGMAGRNGDNVSNGDSGHSSHGDAAAEFVSPPPNSTYPTSSSAVYPPVNYDSDRSSRSSTFPADLSDARDPSLAPLFSSKTGLAPPSVQPRRSVSPAGRFRDVFRKKSSAASTNGSPERPRSETGRSETGRAAASPSAPPAVLISTADTHPHGFGHTFSSPAPAIDPEAAGGAASASAHESSDTAKQRFRRLSRGQKIDTAARPETPPSSDPAAPLIVNTPPTPTDLGLPMSTAPERSRPATSYHPSAPLAATSPSASAAPTAGGNSAHAPLASSTLNGSSSMTSQRRSRAGSTSLVPSKLSSYTLAPLTPTPENGPATPSSSGFFSSMFSAAQSATNSLSNTITGTSIGAPWNNNNKKPGTSSGTRDLDQQQLQDESANQNDSNTDDRVEVESVLDSSFTAPAESKEPAVKTLGMGDLSLSQLGIVDQPKVAAANTPNVANGAPVPGVGAAGTSSGYLSDAGSGGDPAAANGASVPAVYAQSKLAEINASDARNRSESAPADSFHSYPGSESPDRTGTEETASSAARPSSLYDAHGEQITPVASVYDDRQDSFQRTSSIRSAIERRRKRGSSAATGGTATTIAAAIAAANASLAHPVHPAAHASTPKLTGFAVASKKRNRDFHSFFKSVPDDDYLIEDYSCALQREILAHGRLYVSEGHLCFSSNILGWVTTLVLSFDEIVSVEKRSTALVFKNGLMISTLHAKHIFASFASRDSTYDLIVKIWKLGHPSLQSSINGVHIDETGGDKTEKIEMDDADAASIASRSASASDEESDEDSDEVYDEDAEDDIGNDSTFASEPGAAGLDGDGDRAVSRKASGTGGAANGGSTDKPKDSSAAPAGGDFPGPQTHAPTDCGDTATHYDKILADETIPAPLGKTFSYMFGATSVSWMTKWLTAEQKCFDLQMADKKGLGPDNRTRTSSYIKPLNGSIGPKQTKCIVTEQIEAIDYDKAINVVCSTQTPDVPGGNVFVVKTKYCLSWGENNTTRIQANCTIEWSGKSWLKVAIEKGANDGQMQYCRDLFGSLREAVSSRPRSNTAPNGASAGAGAGGKSGRRKGRKGKTPPPTGPSAVPEGTVKPSVAQDWGMLEPIHGIVGPLVDIAKPLLTGNVMYGLLVGLLVASWFGFGLTGRQQQSDGLYRRDLDHWAYPDRMAAYDEMWRREESELWDWLEERVSLNRLGNENQPPRKKALEPRTVAERLQEERMNDREIREAIRVTEEKLQVLKSVAEQREGAGK